MRLTLSKSDVLRGYQSFGDVMSGGRSFIVRPVRCFYQFDPAGDRGVRVGFGVSRNLRKAVLRNRIKRRLREAYRLNKNILIGGASVKEGGFRIVFMYTDKDQRSAEKMQFPALENAMISILKKLQSEIRETP